MVKSKMGGGSVSRNVGTWTIHIALDLNLMFQTSCDMNAIG